jgi:oxygen-independent coproporphyrinogen-3 oxidase
MQMLGDARYEHYEISNHARPGYSSVHNRAYWAGENYLGIGPSAFSTIEMKRWQNVADYRSYSDRVLAGDSVVTSMEELNDEVKRGEIIALSLRTQNGVPASWLKTRPNKRDEFLALGLLRQHDSNFVLTQKGKLLADTVAEAFV